MIPGVIPELAQLIVAYETMLLNRALQCLVGMSIVLWIFYWRRKRRWWAQVIEEPLLRPPTLWDIGCEELRAGIPFGIPLGVYGLVILIAVLFES